MEESNRNFWIYSLFFVALFLSVVSVYVSYNVYQLTLVPISGYSSQQATISFSVEGDAVGSTPGSSGGGGGGGYGTPNFIVNKDALNLQIVSGESETYELIVENTGSGTVIIAVSVSGIGPYISFNTNNLVVASGRKAPLIFTINAPEPGVYAGKIFLTYQGISREVLVLINVVSEGVLFDATVTVPDLYRVLSPGQRLPTLIELTEVGANTGVDVTMNYIIKDFDGNVHYTESETFYVLGTKSYSKRFSTAGLEPGDYVLGVELVYPGGFATSSAHFKISESAITSRTLLAIVSGFVALLVVALALLFFNRRKNDKKTFKQKRGVN